jgi:hypothetical protein
VHQAQLLLHAAGELAHRAVAEGVQAGHASTALALGEFGRHQAQAAEEVHVLLDGQVGVEVEAQALGQEADAVLDLLGAPFAVQQVPKTSTVPSSKASTPATAFIRLDLPAPSAPGRRSRRAHGQVSPSAATRLP